MLQKISKYIFIAKVKVDNLHKILYIIYFLFFFSHLKSHEKYDLIPIIETQTSKESKDAVRTTTGRIVKVGCDICGEFVSPHELSRHKIVTHNNKIKAKLVPCPFAPDCDKMFYDEKQAKRHTLRSLIHNPEQQIGDNDAFA
jgi:hypothetical protein